MLLQRDESVLLVIDIQQRLLPTMDDPETVVRHSEMLLRAASELAVPVMVSEQYPKGLGPTVSPLRELAAGGRIFEKMAFSCTGETEILRHLKSLGRRQLVLCGIEAHVCVLQTALGLRQEGYDVFVAEDATSSRSQINLAAGRRRMAANNIEMVSTEMVIFEWLQVAGTAEFKTLSKLIK
ncbi:MAG: hydrolase [Rhodospirillales bacterium]